MIVVDDEVLVREAICKKLDWGKIGFELLGGFENGQMAKEFLEGNPVDVVLTDICMPYMDGMELSRFLYESRPEVKIVVFSGFDEFEYAKKAICYRVEEYLLKPVTSAELSEILVRLKSVMDAERAKKDKNARLSRAVNKNRIYMQSRELCRLLEGGPPVEECVKELAEHGIFIDGKQFLAGILLFQGEQSSLFHFILYNMVHEIMQKHGLGFVCMGDEYRIFLLFAADHGRRCGFKEKVQQCLAEIQEVILTNTQSGTSIAVGKFAVARDEISASFQAAKECMQYIYTAGPGEILWAEELIRPGEAEVNLSEETKKLMVLVRENRQAAVEECLAGMSHKLSLNCVERTNVCVKLQMCAKALYGMAEQSTGSLGMSPLPPEEQTILRIERADFLEDAIEGVRQIAAQLGRWYEQELGGYQKRAAVLAMDYIMEHYADSELTLTEVCSRFGVSVSRFSANFKSRYDETFTEALTRIRMEKAKQLICNTDLKNYEIAERIGFADPHYFSVAFKKVTGMTPTEWGREHVGA